MCSIVFANKAVLTIINFRFVYALTLLHVLTTVFGMLVFAWMGLYERKKLPLQPLVSLSIAFVGYIVFWNISLQVMARQSAHGGYVLRNKKGIMSHGSRLHDGQILGQAWEPTADLSTRHLPAMLNLLSRDYKARI